MPYINGKLKSVAAGIFAGAANGFFGGGGGMLLIPLLTRWIKLDERKAFATSILVISAMSAVSSAVYFCRTGISLTTSAPYLVGGLIGGFLGGRLFKRVPTLWLRRGLALLIIFGGIRALL